MTAPSESHLFLSVGLASCIVLAMAAIGLGVWNAYWHTRIKDQVEQVIDMHTPSFAESMPEEEPTVEMPIGDARAEEVRLRPSPVPRKKTEVRVIGGREFEFAVESPGADSSREAEAL